MNTLTSQEFLVHVFDVVVWSGVEALEFVARRRIVWLISVIERKGKGSDGRKDTVQVRILKPKDIEMLRSPDSFKNILVSSRI